MNRETLIAELNKADADVETLRSTDSVDADALSTAIVKYEAVLAQLRGFDAKNPVIEADTVAAKDSTFAARAAEALATGTFGVEHRVSIGSAWDDTSVAFPQTAGVVTTPDQPVRFIDTLPTAPATSDTVLYVKETGYLNAAEARLAGDPTAESNIAFAKVSEPIANIATKFVVPEENMRDMPVLESIVTRKGLTGVRRVQNAQLLAAPNATKGV